MINATRKKIRMKWQPCYVTALVICTLISCKAGNNTNVIVDTSANDTLSNGLMNDSIDVPAGYQELLEVRGNLDSTEADEKVIVYNTERMVEMGRLREIRIYKSKNMKWSLWHSSVGAILPSEHGGALGDPLQEIEIKNGSIVISHLGGGIEKWSYRHQYRFQQNDWKLIGARVFFGMPCDTMQNFDYDLITGNIQY